MLKPLLYVLASVAAFILATYAVTAYVVGRALHQLRWRA